MVFSVPQAGWGQNNSCSDLLWDWIIIKVVKIWVRNVRTSVTSGFWYTSSSLPPSLPPSLLYSIPSSLIFNSKIIIDSQFSSVQSLSRVHLFVTAWTAALQASLSITSSWSLLKLMSIESVMPSNHLILCRPLLCPPSIFPSIGSFHMSQFESGGQSIGVSASALVFPMNIQDWFPLGWIGLIPLQSKGLSKVFSNTTVPSRR